jgi:hypothetical protein
MDGHEPVDPNLSANTAGVAGIPVGFFPLTCESDGCEYAEYFNLVIIFII